MDPRIAQRYAKAAFAAATKIGAVREVEAELDALTEMYAGPGPLREWLLSPRVAREAKIQRLPEILGRETNPLTVSLVSLLLRKGRQQELPAVADAFRELRRQSERVVHAQVVSARDLEERERTELVLSLERRIGKRVEPSFVTDPSLLGGVRVSIDNTVLDGTVRGSLQRLRRILETDVLMQV